MPGPRGRYPESVLDQVAEWRAAGVRVGEIARRLEFSIERCHAVFKALRRREQRMISPPPPHPAQVPRVDPSPDEIAARLAELRARWSPEEEQRRAGAGRNPGVQLGEVRDPMRDFY